MAKRRINNALRYLGFRNRCNGPGEVGSCRAVDEQRPGPVAGGGREEGWMSAPCTVDVDLLCYRHSPYLEMPW